MLTAVHIFAAALSSLGASAECDATWKQVGESAEKFISARGVDRRVVSVVRHRTEWIVVFNARQRSSEVPDSSQVTVAVDLCGVAVGIRKSP